MKKPSQRTDYHFDGNQRLIRINHVDHKTIVRQEAFQWSSKKGQEGWLKSKSVKLDEDIYYLKSFRYDDRGNIVKETLYGNSTGEKPETFTIDQLESTDSYSIHYRYSEDGFNLPLEKKTPEGLVLTYAYLPGTNLCTKELQSYEDKIQERIFRVYDTNGQIQQLIEDDGSSDNPDDLTGVTYRRMMITDSVKLPHSASYGKPAQQTTAYLDLANGQMTVLKRIEFSYDERGNEITKRLYNSQNTFCYESTKKYDARNRLSEECNALGQTTRYTYDDNNNLKKKESPELWKKHLLCV